MAKQQVLDPSRRATTLATLGFAALILALLGMTWTMSARMYAPVTGPTTPVSAPAAPVTNSAPANRFFADEIAGANAQYADAAILTDPLPERLQDVRRPATSLSAPATPPNQVRLSNRFFADEVFGSGGSVDWAAPEMTLVQPLSGPR